MPNITAAQFFIMLFLCRAFTFFTLTPGSGRSLSDTSAVLSLFLACIGSIVLLLPAWAMLHKQKKMGMIEYAYQKSPTAGTIAASFFALYALYEAVGTISHFTLFITTAIYPGESAWIFVVLFTLAAMYLVWMGLEATARLSGLILWTLVFSVALIIAALVPEWNSVNLASPLLGGAAPVVQGSAVTLGETAELVPVLLFAPALRSGNRGMRRGFLWWTLAVFLTLGGMTLLTVATVGEYTVTQTYPIYAIAKMARLFYFQRLDALHMVVWTLMGLVKTALFLYLSRQCLSCILGPKAQKWVLPVTGGVAIAAALLLSTFYRAYEAYEAVALSGVPLLLGALLLPLILRLLPNKKGEST